VLETVLSSLSASIDDDKPDAIGVLRESPEPVRSEKHVRTNVNHPSHAPIANKEDDLMTTWTKDELRRIDGATELRVASQRADGTMRPYVTIWHTTVGDALYIRSARGPENGWFRRAKQAGVGCVDAGGVSKAVKFELADPAVRSDLDKALHNKYDRFGPTPVGAITGDDVLETTLKVLPTE
jgi:hypothetical protein